MFSAYIVVTVLAAAANIYAATSNFRQVDWIVISMHKLGVPRSWLIPLGVLKGLGAFGLLIGLVVPWIGVAAAIGLVLFFVNAISFTLRARWYANLAYPGVWLVLAVGSLGLRVATAYPR